MSQPPKSRIRQSFERAAATYDGAAEVQRRICKRLADKLPAAGIPVSHILDAGCGTGYALALLQHRFPAATLVALDFSKAMIDRVSGTPRVVADIEHLPLPDASLDLYWSSLTVQWSDLAQTLREARRCLKPGGLLAIATLGEGTFDDLRNAFQQIDGHTHTLSFASEATLLETATAAGLTIHTLDCETEIAFYPDLRAQLQAVKAVGANQVGAGRRTGLLGREAFARLTATCERTRTLEGLPLRYEVRYLIAEARP